MSFWDRLLRRRKRKAPVSNEEAMRLALAELGRRHEYRKKKGWIRWHHIDDFRGLKLQEETPEAFAEDLLYLTADTYQHRFLYGTDDKERSAAHQRVTDLVLLPMGRAGCRISSRPCGGPAVSRIPRAPQEGFSGPLQNRAVSPSRGGGAMPDSGPRSGLTRREFLRTAAAGALLAAAPQSWARGVTPVAKHKTVLSFYCDDTTPYGRPPDTFRRFVDFVSGEGLAGESTVLLGSGAAEHGLLSRPTTDLQKEYIAQLHRAAPHLDANMEVVTHGGLFDFAKNEVPEGAEHEGVWMYEPAVTVQIYQDYFAHALAEAERIGVRFAGLTWPGCGCEACTKRYAELEAAGQRKINPNVWQALLNLAKQGKFRGPTVPCFPYGETPDAKPMLQAGEGKYAVYDLSPHAGDMLGSYTDSADRASADYYITADGESGRIVDAVRADASYGLFYCHWQGLNPADGVGWEAFRTLVARVQKHLADQVEWLRPSAYTERWRAAELAAGKTATRGQ